jgi:hypothetical protein
MYDFKKISSVNKRYVFFKDETRKVIDIKLLHEVIKDIKAELNHYNFMHVKMYEAYDKLTIKIEETKKVIEWNNKQIELNIDKPVVRRGLSEYHDNLRYNEQLIHDLGMAQSGVFSAYDCDYVTRLRKLCNQCKVVVNQSELKKNTLGGITK